jgi:hypothetical protein
MHYKHLNTNKKRGKIKMTKQCKTCQGVKALEDFYQNKKTGYYQSYCKSCTNAKSKVSYQEQAKRDPVDVFRYLEDKTKYYFMGKTPPEIWQEACQELGSGIDKKQLKKAILEKFELLVKTARVEGVAQKVYHDTAVDPILPHGSISDLSNEEWCDVVGYEGLYLISSQGRVKSLFKDGEKLLKPYVLQGGYLKVSLSKDGVLETGLVHRLVATAFISNPQNHPQVDHWNMRKDQNFLWNLRWVTGEQNAMYRKELKPLFAKEANQYVLAEIHRANTTDQDRKEPNFYGSTEAMKALAYLKTGGK